MCTGYGFLYRGGSIVIREVDNEIIEFTGDYPTLIIKHRDIPGMVSKVTAILYEEGINIAFMKVFRNKKVSLLPWYLKLILWYLRQWFRK